MAKGGQVQLGEGDRPPDRNHFPQSDIIKEQPRAFFQSNRGEIVQQGCLHLAVFGSVHKEQIGLAQQSGVAARDLQSGQVGDDLLESAIGQIRGRQDSPRILGPRDDVERGQARARRQKLLQSQRRQTGGRADFDDIPRLEDLNADR